MRHACVSREGDLTRGPESIVWTFVDVNRFREIHSFEPEAVFVSDEFAAMFGRFTYRSTALSKAVTTPFAVFARVQGGRCTYLQFMEDTFATAASFPSGGTWIFQYPFFPRQVALKFEMPLVQEG
jgi:uncharacterized protein